MSSVQQTRGIIALKPRPVKCFRNFRRLFSLQISHDVLADLFYFSMRFLCILLVFHRLCLNWTAFRRRMILPSSMSDRRMSLAAHTASTDCMKPFCQNDARPGHAVRLSLISPRFSSPAVRVLFSAPRQTAELSQSELKISRLYPNLNRGRRRKFDCK